MWGVKKDEALAVFERLEQGTEVNAAADRDLPPDDGRIGDRKDRRRVDQHQVVLLPGLCDKLSKSR